MLAVIDRRALLAAIGDWSRGPDALYIGLADAIQRAVERGDIPPRTRLPAERSLAASLAVSRGTVVAAYERLRELGIVDTRQGSGTWVRLEAARPISVVNDPFAGRAPRPRRPLARQFDACSDCIDLARTAPANLDAWCAGYFANPVEHLGRLGAGHDQRPLGLDALRGRIAARYTAAGVLCDPANVAVTDGAQSAIALIAALVLKPGDAVVVEAPTFPGALDAFARAGARIVAVPAEEGRASVAALRDAVTRNAARIVYLMPGGHRPLGAVMPAAVRQQVAAVADAHEVYVVEDDSLSTVSFDRRHLAPVAAYSRSGRVLTIGSLNRLVWSGLGIGWLRGDRTVIEMLGRLKAASSPGPSMLPQVVACNLLDDLPAVMTARVEALRYQREILEHELSASRGWMWSTPEAGMALWVQLPYGDADDFTQHAMRRGVDVTPGSAFCLDDSQAQRLQIAYTQPPEVLAEGAKRLAAAWAEYAGSLRSSGQMRGQNSDAVDQCCAG